MNQPTSTRQYHVYYVVWQARNSVGQLAEEGACEVPISAPITSYNDILAIAQSVRVANSVGDGLHMRIVNFIPLRIQTLPSSQGAQA